MMHSNLCAAYPKYIELKNGRKMRIRADVYTALLCIDALSDPALEEADKTELVLALFLPFFIFSALRLLPSDSSVILSNLLPLVNLFTYLFLPFF